MVISVERKKQSHKHQQLDRKLKVVRRYCYPPHIFFYMSNATSSLRKYWGCGYHSQVWHAHKSGTKSLPWKVVKCSCFERAWYARLSHTVWSRLFSNLYVALWSGSANKQTLQRFVVCGHILCAYAHFLLVYSRALLCGQRCCEVGGEKATAFVAALRHYFPLLLCWFYEPQMKLSCNYALI